MYTFFFPYYGACHFSKRKKVMRNQCKVLSHPPLFSGADRVSTATPSASGRLSVCRSRPCSSPSAPFSLLSLPLPRPPPIPKVIFLKKELEVSFFVDVFTYWSNFVWGQRSRQSRCCGSSPAPSLGVGRGARGLAPGGPRPWLSVFLSRSASRGGCRGGPGPVRGEEAQPSD